MDNHEKEVLFKSRSKFKIVDVKDDYIELLEVSRKTESFIMIYEDTYTSDTDIIKKLGLDEIEEREESLSEKHII